MHRREKSNFYFFQKNGQLCFKAMEKEDMLDISDIKKGKIEEVVVHRNQLWEKVLQYEEQLKNEKEISVAYQTEASQLKEQLKELQNKHEKDLKETADHHTTEINQLNARNKEFLDKLHEQHKKSAKDLQERIITYESEATKLNETIHQLQRKLDEVEDQKKRNDSDMRAIIDSHESELNQMISENHQLKDQLQKVREDSVKTLQKTYGGHPVQQVNELAGKNIELKNLLREEKENNEKTMQEKASKHDSEVKQLNEKIDRLEEQLKLEEKERKQEHKKEIDHLKQSFQDERQKLEEQLECFHRQARKRPIQLSYLGKGDLMQKVLEELKMTLVDKLGMKRHELQFVTCLKESDVDPDIPLLALCINMLSRGTDASTTMKNIQASNNVLLVILHHKEEHALPSQTSNCVLIGPEFRELAGIYDIGFLADKGIYSCNKNNTAIDGIVEFITKKVTTLNSKPVM